MNDIDSLMAYLRGQDWHIDITGKHYKITNPENGKMVTIPCTPSEYRSMKNSIAELRRAGLVVPHKVTKPKAKKQDESVAIEACESLGVDLVIAPFPHITDIIGSYRSASWFDRDTMLPLTDEQWPGPSDRNLAATALITSIADFRPKDRVGAFYLHEGKDARSLPGQRTRRIRADAIKFWSYLGHGDVSPEPRHCSCGFNAAETPEGIYHLADHIVTKHERAQYHHYPLGDLYPYADPLTLERMFDPDERDNVIARQEETIRELRETVEGLHDKLVAIKRALA